MLPLNPSDLPPSPKRDLVSALVFLADAIDLARWDDTTDRQAAAFQRAGKLVREALALVTWCAEHTPEGHACTRDCAVPYGVPGHPAEPCSDDCRHGVRGLSETK